jgi:hypothetical protein
MTEKMTSQNYLKPSSFVLADLHSPTVAISDKNEKEKST